MRPCYFNVGLCACHTGPGCLADPPPTDADRAAAQAGRERDEDMSGTSAQNIEILSSVEVLDGNQ